MPAAIFSISEAVELGQFVLAAYGLFAANDPADFVPPAGYQLISKVYADDLTDNLPDYKVFGFIARSGSDVVVAIRGTQGGLEFLMDAHFIPVPFPYVDAGKTEQGFTNFYSTLRTGPDVSNARAIDALRVLISAGGITTLRITGHSLGAALATLLAIDLSGNNVFVGPKVYTFASPRVGPRCSPAPMTIWFRSVRTLPTRPTSFLSCRRRLQATSMLMPRFQSIPTTDPNTRYRAGTPSAPT